MNAKQAAKDFAILGGTPALSTHLPVGQMYFPTWDRYEAAMRGIFEREYYTNHGPLAQDFEARLAAFLSVRHAISVANATLGLIMAVKALSLTGRVIVPAHSFIASAQSLTWAGVEPVFCDVDPRTNQMSHEHVEHLLRHEIGISAVLGVNLWGGACDPRGLEAIAARYGVSLYFDSAHGFACKVSGTPLGGFGRLEVFSFHATKIFSTTEGGCITTNDDLLAARLRNIRSSYGAGPAVDVPMTSNGRFSEAQAAIGLLNLETLDAAIANNRASFERYSALLGPVPGIEVLSARGVSDTNYQYLVCEIEESVFGMSRDTLLSVLKAEDINARRYFYPGIHRSRPYVDDFPQYVNTLPGTDRLCGRLLQLPIGALASIENITKVCGVIAGAQRHAPALLQGIARKS
jgi:dTDP-4-amino-4,6-dideoxygalactose transaminase